MLENLQECPICKSKTKVEDLSDTRSYSVTCQRCGRYKITDEALTKYQNSELSDKVLSVSYWIRQHQSEDRHPIYIDLIRMRSLLIPFAAPKPNEQANNLILWLGDNQNGISDGKSIEFSNLISIIGCFNKRDVEHIVHHLVRQNLLSSQNISANISIFTLTLSFDGWEKYYELKTTSKDSRLAFMAMQYDNTSLQNIFNDVIKDAVSETGFEIRKLDDVKTPGSIDDKLRVEIRRSKFLLADLTDENRGAYWEAGYAEGLGIPVIYLCEQEKFEKLSTHFDTNHNLTVKWKENPDSLKKFAEELKATIRATFPAEAKMED